MPLLGFWLACCSLVGPVHEGLDEQIAELTRRIVATPADTALYLRRSELHRLHRCPELALADVERAAKLDPDCAGLDLARGKALLDGGAPAEAEVALTRFLTLHGDDADGLLARARARVAGGKLAVADDDYARAIAALPEPLPEHFAAHARVVAARGAEHWARALAILDAGQARIGINAALQAPAIELELVREQWDAAIARIDTLARQSERRETWLDQRGDVLARAGRREQAREAWRAALAALAQLPAKQRNTRAMLALQGSLDAKLAEVVR